jgi:site-specific recombinase XerD
LTAIRSFFRYAALETPQHSGLIQRVLAIPNKRQARPLVGFLTRPEIDALLATPDRDTWLGRRDHALLLTVVQTGLRLAEATSIRQQDVCLATGAHVRCEGKGRKERCTPLTKSTVTVLTAWIREQGADGTRILFPARAAAVSAPMRFSIWLRSTLQPHNKLAHHWPRSVFRRMFFATPPRWSCCRPG